LGSLRRPCRPSDSRAPRKEDRVSSSSIGRGCFRGSAGLVSEHARRQSLHHRRLANVSTAGPSDTDLLNWQAAERKPFMTMGAAVSSYLRLRGPGLLAVPAVSCWWSRGRPGPAEASGSVLFAGLSLKFMAPWPLLFLPCLLWIHRRRSLARLDFVNQNTRLLACHPFAGPAGRATRPTRDQAIGGAR